MKTLITQERIEFLYNEAKESNQEFLEEFKMHKDYYNGKQLPDDVLSVLKERGQPPIFENIYYKIGNKIIGFKLAGKQDIKVVPRKQEDKNTASLMSDLLKSITDTEEYSLEKHDCDIDLLLGLGVWEVCIRELEEEDSVGVKLREVFLKHIPTESFLFDPTSLKSHSNNFAENIYNTKEFPQRC
ncbi:hypothetical protein CCZ01_00935 [Helicobacter monodelphidis]|uniref:portal protein n=1 Tax=Helicobacter sp. 15-1451 TaxID=2004995 RepID=UPI000DCE683A|nr:hypothetical protein [Helicobacter sp. 15-1451]RAX59331.1 hypothetical protein CCZ01_00935 [Helicobacter sp. 15-1451]